MHDGQPFVIPTLYARIGDDVYVHGSAASRMLRTLDGGVDACLTVTLVDGLVLARSIFNHSINYRSVVVLGRAAAVEEREEKLRALEAFSDRLVPGRWADVRPPTAKELKATSILRLPLDEVSAKMRTGPPRDLVRRSWMRSFGAPWLTGCACRPSLGDDHATLADRLQLQPLGEASLHVPLHRL